MAPMPDHAKPPAKSTARGGPLRRAWISAWIVTLAMGCTTMAFQVFHSIKHGGMPWELAVLYGIVPLLIAMLVLEIVAEWKQAPFAAKGAAYLIMGAAMFLSASATGAVVLHAAPAHWSLLFGALLDGAELLAAYFIMNGPRKADELLAAEARKRAADERAEDGELARLRRELEAVTARAEAEATALRKAVSGAEAERESARSEAEALTARVDSLIRKLAGNGDRKAAGSAPRKRGGNETRKPAGSRAASAPEADAGSGAEVPADLDSEALVLRYLSEGKSASEAGRLAGLSDARGRQIARKLAKTAPQEAAAEGPQ